jgi:hypothetical protein
VHCWLPEQTAPTPQWHWPSSPQLSAKVVLQALQGEPAVPQDAMDEVLQLVAAQHPRAQLDGPHELVQTPLMQLPEEQAMHVEPPLPQTCLVVPGLQAVPSLGQQPVQVTGSHTQAPPTQRLPPLQALFLPHLQAPFVVQLSAVSGSQATQVPVLGPQVRNEMGLQAVPSQHPVRQEVEVHAQALLWQTWPAPQAGAVPQAHVPSAAHALALVVSHGLQGLPEAPQALTDVGLVQVSPAQQPVRHEVGSQ